MLDAPVRLRSAVKEGKLPIVKRLVRRYPELLENINPENGWSSLHYAGYHGHYQVCVFLVSEGHDRDEISLDHQRSTPLHLAASKNHEQTVHFLAQHIPRCLNWRNLNYETAVMVAARYGHDPCINLLLDFGADIDLGNRQSNRPIHIAAAYGHVKILRTLVDRNADVQTPNAEGWRPVQYCSTYQIQDYLQSLIHEKREQRKRTNVPAGPATALTTPGLSSIGQPPNGGQPGLGVGGGADFNKPLPPMKPTPKRQRSLDVISTANQSSPSPPRKVAGLFGYEKPLPTSPVFELPEKTNGNAGPANGVSRPLGRSQSSIATVPSMPPPQNGQTFSAVPAAAAVAPAPAPDFYPLSPTPSPTGNEQSRSRVLEVSVSTGRKSRDDG